MTAILTHCTIAGNPNPPAKLVAFFKSHRSCDAKSLKVSFMFWLCWLGAYDVAITAGREAC